MARSKPPSQIESIHTDVAAPRRSRLGTDARCPPRSGRRAGSGRPDPRRARRSSWRRPTRSGRERDGLGLRVSMDSSTLPRRPRPPRVKTDATLTTPRLPGHAYARRRHAMTCVRDVPCAVGVGRQRRRDRGRRPRELFRRCSRALREAQGHALRRRSTARQTARCGSSSATTAVTSPSARATWPRACAPSRRGCASSLHWTRSRRPSARRSCAPDLLVAGTP